MGRMPTSCGTNSWRDLVDRMAQNCLPPATLRMILVHAAAAIEIFFSCSSAECRYSSGRRARSGSNKPDETGGRGCSARSTSSPRRDRYVHCSEPSFVSAAWADPAGASRTNFGVPVESATLRRDIRGRRVRFTDEGDRGGSDFGEVCADVGGGDALVPDMVSAHDLSKALALVFEAMLHANLFSPPRLSRDPIVRMHAHMVIPGQVEKPFPRSAAAILAATD
jgi:hypothetical protein